MHKNLLALVGAEMDTYCNGLFYLQAPVAGVDAEIDTYCNDLFYLQVSVKMGW